LEYNQVLLQILFELERFPPVTLPFTGGFIRMKKVFKINHSFPKIVETLRHRFILKSGAGGWYVRKPEGRLPRFLRKNRCLRASTIFGKGLLILRIFFMRIKPPVKGSVTGGNLLRSKRIWRRT
jgi:hypothetical protein